MGATFQRTFTTASLGMQHPKPLKKDTVMHAYVINLNRRTDRRLAISRQLEAVGIGITWIDAVDGSDPTFRKNYQSELTRTSLFPNEYACYLSHIAAWEALLAGPLAHALIIEDDAQLVEDFASIVEILVPHLKKTPLIRLSALQKQVGHKIADLGTHHRLILPTKSLSGTQGYLISRDGAEKMKRKLGAIDSSIDTCLDRYWMIMTPIAGVAPSLINQDQDSPSDIGKEGRKVTSRDHRIIPRIAESITKHSRILWLLFKIKFQ